MSSKKLTTGAPPMRGPTPQGIGFNTSVNANPAYVEVFIYDVAGEPIVGGDTFTLNEVTQTVENSGGVTAGPFGYVQDFDASLCHLKVTIGEGSSAFAANRSIFLLQ